MTEPDEPTTTAGMMKALHKASDGTNVIGESMKTFSMTEGKNKKGDVTHSAADMAGAIAQLKNQVATAKGKAKEGKKKDMWDLTASPHGQMGKTLDDVYTAFLMWARLGSGSLADLDAHTSGSWPSLALASSLLTQRCGTRHCS